MDIHTLARLEEWLNPNTEVILATDQEGKRFKVLRQIDICHYDPKEKEIVSTDHFESMEDYEYYVNKRKLPQCIVLWPDDEKMMSW